MFTEPFRLPAGHNLALWANEFSKGFGYVRPYSLNGIRGTLVIVASYDSIAYITTSLTGASTDYVLLSASGKRIEPAEDRGLIDAEKVLAGYEYGDSYEEGFRIDDDEEMTQMIGLLAAIRRDSRQSFQEAAALQRR